MTERNPIERLRVKNFGCLKDVDIELTPLHAFIGPNDSGKSTILQAMKALIEYACGGSSALGEFSPYFNEETKWNVKFADDLQFELGAQVLSGEVTLEDVASVKEIKSRVTGQRLIRFDPDRLREPSSLITDEGPLRFVDERGTGLPGVYDAIVNRDVEAFLEIQQNVRRLFPPVKKVQLRNPTSGTKAIEIELISGQRISAQYISEGLLFYLAYAAIPALEPTSVLLVEEPENGLHPARIAEVVRTLREISKQTQVLIATHSPMVVNALQPEEVSIVTRDPKSGTQVRRLKDTPNFEARSKVYALGELWVSYANGKDEAPLFAEPEAQEEPADEVEWNDEDDPGAEA